MNIDNSQEPKVKATKTNFELGVQRLYYVLWALWIFGCVVYLQHTDNWWQVAAVVVLSMFAGPLAVMLVVRWIYRGFNPKQRTPSAPPTN